MIAFVNTFLSYLILTVLSIGVIVLAVFCGKKLRDVKDEKDANKTEEVSEAKE